MTLSSPRWSRLRSLELVTGSGKHSDSDSVYDIQEVSMMGHVVVWQVTQLQWQDPFFTIFLGGGQVPV